MTRIKEVIDFLETWAPPSLAESYDNVGLLVGDKNKEVSGVMVSLDCTEEVVREAIDKKCNLIVSHHPIIFKGLKKLTGSNYVERTVELAIKNDIALYAIHTNLDNIQTGVNKRIAHMIGLENTTILQPKAGILKKLEFFVPESSADMVRKAIFEAGAGRIGNYDNCSFNTSGTGTFTPEGDANPTIGQLNKMQFEPEVKIEILVPSYLVSSAIAAMKSAHPYEEVAYYLHDLVNPNQEVGAGMIGVLSAPMNVDDFFRMVKEKLGLQVIKSTKFVHNKIESVAVCGGSGSFLLRDAIRRKADVFITSDFKYHEFFDAENAIIIADIGHYESERFTIDLIGEQLSKKFRNFATRLTEVNTNPIHFII